MLSKTWLNRKHIPFVTFARALNITALLATGVLFTGCGNLMSRPYVTGTGYGNSTPVDGTVAPVVAPVTATTGTTGPTGPASSGAPTYFFKVRGVGYNPQTISVSAGQVLKVRWTPGEQDTAVSGTNFYPAYSQLGVYIQVGVDDAPTPMLSNGLVSAAQSSPIMDYSAYLNNGCSTGSTTCRSNATVTIQNPNNDYWCYNYGEYCPWSHVYDSHPWNGTLEVQTDDTDALQ